MHKFVNYHGISGQCCERQLHEFKETQEKVGKLEVPLLNVDCSSYIIVKKHLKSNFKKGSLPVSPRSAPRLGVLRMVSRGHSG